MKGAREYYRIIDSAVHYKLGNLENVTHEIHKKHGGVCHEAFKLGNIIFILSEHARGKTFKIWLCDNDIKLEVYGIKDGNPGWTETYGWTKKGTWTKFIIKYLRDLEKEINTYKENIEQEKRQKLSEKNKIIAETVNHFNAIFR